MAKIVFLLTIIIALMSSCKQSPKQTEVTDINIDLSNILPKINLSQIATNVELVSLSDVNAPIIGEIIKAVMHNDTIYVSDGKGIYVYKKNGDYIKALNKTGRAANEYISITDFIIDKKGLIWILSRSNKKILHYNIDGSFISKHKLEHWVSKISLQDDGRMCLFAGNQKDKNNQHQLNILNLVTGNIENNFVPISDNKATYLHVYGANNYIQSNNQTLFYQMFCDTIYEVSHSNISPKYFINYDGKNIPSSFFDNKYENVMEFFMSLNKYDYARGVNMFLSTQNAFWIAYYYKSEALINVSNQSQSITSSVLYDDMCLKGYELSLEEKSMFTLNDNTIAIPIWHSDLETYINSLSKTQAQNFENKYGKISSDSNSFLFIITAN